MALRYTAKIFSNKKVIAKQEGDDVDDLHAWMLAKSEGKFSDFHGVIIDNETGATVRSFKKCPPD